MTRLSIAAIAAAAGVHRTTASRILAGVADRQRYAASTVAAVLAAAAGLGWRDATRHESQIGIVGGGYVADVHSAFTEVYHALSAELTRRQRMLRHVRVGRADDWQPDHASCIDGGILTTGVESFWNELRTSWRLPGVALNWAAAAPAGLDVVHPDDLAGATALARHLIAAGHRHLALVMPLNQDHAWSIDARRAGITRTISGAGGRVEEWILADEYGGHEIAERLAADDRPTAVITYSVYQLIALLPILEHHGLRCPDDLSLACCDDHPDFAAVAPPITAVHLPVAAMAQAAVDLVLARIDGTAPSTEQQVVLPAPLIHRASIRAVG